MMMIVAVVIAGQSVSEQPDSGRADRCGSWIDHLHGAAVGIIGGGAAGTEGKDETGGEQTI
jgi:hypothetical protein